MNSRYLTISKRHFLALSISLIIVTSCQDREVINDTGAIFQHSEPSDSLSFYFPDTLNLKSHHAMYNDFQQNWFSSSLYSFKEPILKNTTGHETIYRFLWLRSFDQPVCYCLKEFNGRYYLSSKTLDRSPRWYPEIKGRFENDTLVSDTIHPADRKAHIDFKEIITISESEWQKFENLLVKNIFWRLPNLDPYPAAMDGSEWILEAYTDRKYHFVVRQGGRDIVDVGRYLISLSNLHIPKDRIY